MFCDELNNVISCFHDRVMSCCSGVIGPVYLEGYKGEKIDWDAFKAVKKNAFDFMNKLDIDKLPCKDCFFLRSRKESDKISPTFNMLNISHWVQCNCGCIYCARMQDSKAQITYKSGKSTYYDMLPLLKDLYKHELLDRKNLTVVFQGGDISVLKEFEPLVKECLKNGVGQFHFLTNNIVYQPIIKKLLNMDKALIFTSLDCGSREVYKQLKRVDKFDQCIKNLKNYSKGLENPGLVVKYILVENYNDNKGEIDRFLDLMVDVGVKVIEFQLDNKYGLFTDLENTPLPSHYGDLYMHFKEGCEKRDRKFTAWDKTQATIEKYALKN